MRVSFFWTRDLSEAQPFFQFLNLLFSVQIVVYFISKVSRGAFLRTWCTSRICSESNQTRCVKTRPSQRHAVALGLFRDETGISLGSYFFSATMLPII
jgi:hypothetical protein